MHVVGDFAGEAFNERGKIGLGFLQPFFQIIVFPADQDQLQRQVCFRQRAGDFDHPFRTFAAKQDETRGKLGVETQPAPFLFTVVIHELVEARPQNHAAGEEDAILGVPQRIGLPGSFGVPQMKVLWLRLDPKMRRKIRQVRQDRHHRSFGQAVAQALKQSAIEVGDQRNNQIRLRLLPILFQHLDHLAVIDPQQQVHRGQHLGRAQRPALFQQFVVDILHPDAREFANDVERGQNVLQIDQPDLPGAVLILDNGIESVGGAPVAAAGIKENEIDLLHQASMSIITSSSLSLSEWIWLGGGDLARKRNSEKHIRHFAFNRL